MIKEFKPGHWYMWIGEGKPKYMNNLGEMNFILDNKPHKCKEANGHFASFYDSSSPGRKWFWRPLESFVEVVMDEDEAKSKTTKKKTSSREALEKSIAHWERVVKIIAIADEEEEFPHELSDWLDEMGEGIWSSNCALCKEAGFGLRRGTTACNDCILGQVYGKFGSGIGSPYQKVCCSESWDEALSTSRNMLKVLRSLRKEVGDD